MPHYDERFTSRDGLSLYAQRWLPAADANAVVVIVHGFTEHSSRYARLAEELNQQGYAVYTMDLRGHGKSEGSRCYVKSFDQYLDDLDLLLQTVESREAGKPRFIFGHSMGGPIVAKWAITRQPQVAGVVLSGAALKVAAGMFPLLQRVAWLASLLVPHMRIVRMGSGKLSRDQTVVENFRNDPLVFHGRFPARTGAEILATMRFIADNAQSLQRPLLILHGTGDRLCDVDGARQLYASAGSSDKTIHLYEGLYHEILSEPERAEVLSDLLAWLDARRKGKT
jgi:alpha-beta hydrolase superfamily lysophospholipase